MTNSDSHDRVAAPDGGSTMISALIIMTVLTIGALVLSVVLVNTSGMLADSRSYVQSRAAADAGISAAVAQAMSEPDVCAMSVPSSTSAPRYSVAVTCDASAGRVTFTSTGTGDGGETTVTEAEYKFTASVTPEGVAELVFFNSGSDSVYFTNHVMPETAGMATILFPGGGAFECKTTVPGNIITKGSILGQSGCTITGSLYVGGANPVTGGNALYLNNGDQVLGSAMVVGDVLLGGSPARIGGTLTLPSTASLTANWRKLSGNPTSHAQINGGQAGGIVWSPTIGTPTMEPWFDYAYQPADWPGYDVVTLTATSTPYNCTNWKGSATTFWTAYVSGLTKNTVIDARACRGGMDTALGANSTATLGVNLVFLANAYTLGNLKISAKAGTDPQAWFVVPDLVDDNQPTCPAADSANAWDYQIETDASVNVTVNAMMYTPCKIRIGHGGVWSGSMYGGTLDDGGDIKIYTHAMALPGQWGFGPGGSGSGPTTTTLGELVSQRDVQAPIGGAP